jgi:hypothetical protein
MAIIQLTWVDASTNETKFNVYRSKDGGSEVDPADATTYDRVATLVYDQSATGADWDNSKWVLDATTAPNGAGYPDSTSNFKLTAGFNNDASSANSTFVATYTDESTPSTGYYWAVTAENEIGESAATSTPSTLNIN